MAIERFEQLTAWQRAHALVLDIYQHSKQLPADERFGLTLQMRRAAVSVPANIAEGFKRRTSKDKIHFYNIAQGSLQELKYYILLCRDLDYWQKQDAEVVSSNAEEAGKVLGGLIRSISAGQ